MSARLTTTAELDALRSFAQALAPDADLGLSRGEGSLHLALSVLAQEAIEDVYADCGDTDAGVLSSNVGQRIAHRLASALSPDAPAVDRDGLAEVLAEVAIAHQRHRSDARLCGPLRLGSSWAEHLAAHQADAVLAWIEGQR